MDTATRQAALTALRTVVAVIGGIVTTKGVVSEADWQLYSGAVLTIVPVLWEVWASLHKERKAAAREVTALNVGIALSNQTPEPTPLVPAVEAKAVIDAYAPAVQPTPEGPKP